MKKKYFLALVILIMTLSLVFIGLHFYRTKFPFKLTVSNFTDLPGWNSDDQSQALVAFQQSCIEIQKRNPAEAVTNIAPWSSAATWQTICQAAQQIKSNDKTAAKKFFENEFRPYLVTDEGQAEGLFTGYYLPMLRAHLHKSNEYNIPIYGKPKDLINVNLGLFKTTMQGIVIKGQLKDEKILPYPDRVAINAGVIHNTAPIIAWINNRVNLFFMQVQGSGLIKLPHHKILLLGYADTNGRSYKSLGKVFITNGILPKEKVSMETIKAWLETHPDQINTMLNTNPSYVFFRILDTKNPLGRENVPLTPERSLAVDTRYIPLGAPVWINTFIPKTEISNNTPLQKLVIAQDTGGAIKGIVRADVYWGSGNRAEHIASDMKSSGEYWVLLPK